MLVLSLLACNSQNELPANEPLNSRFHDDQPSLSGDGTLLAFTTNRNGQEQIALYDLEQRRFLDAPGLNRSGVIATNPSLSRTGRYLVYLTSVEGRLEIALYDRITAQAEILTRTYRHWVRNPQISADGRYISFETARRGQWDIEVLDRGPNIELDIADGTPLDVAP
ncbi:MAG: TolB family protein [Spirulinaceae cyanobacterium SM2_1_0]|nr:TolB family protein [Spirulinaceae cyanobacterium SM2_1_0]